MPHGSHSGLTQFPSNQTKFTHRIAKTPFKYTHLSPKFSRKIKKLQSEKRTMIGPANFMDEIDCGSFFDHIDDLLDFPTDDIEACLSGPDCTTTTKNNNANANSFPSIWSTQSDSIPCSDSVFSNNSASDLSAELSVPVSFKNFHYFWWFGLM